MGAVAGDAASDGLKKVHSRKKRARRNGDGSDEESGTEQGEEYDSAEEAETTAEETTDSAEGGRGGAAQEKAGGLRAVPDFVEGLRLAVRARLQVLSDEGGAKMGRAPVLRLGLPAGQRPCVRPHVSSHSG